MMELESTIADSQPRGLWSRQLALGLCAALALCACGAKGSTSFDSAGAGGASGEVISLNCGNGEIDPGEECEPGDLDGSSCEEQGYGGGILGCDPRICAFDTSMCTEPVGGSAATGG